MKKVTIVGGGFAGLTLALRLAQKNFQVHLYEKTSRLGGLLGTEITEHGPAEQAANALLATARAEALWQELNLPMVKPLESAKNRYIFRGQMKRWPLSFFETLGFVFRLLPVVVLGKKHIKPRPGQSLRAWGQERLGTPATDFLLEPAMQGIYGSAADDLSASLVLGGLFSANRERYKGMMTGPRGMQDLVDALEKKLRELNVQIHLQSEAPSLDGTAVIATSAPAAASLLREKAPAVAALLAGVRMKSLCSVKLFFARAGSFPLGFGCLIPQKFGLNSLGVLFNTTIFAGRDKTYNETWILTNTAKSDIMSLTDTELLKKIAQDRAQVLDSKEPLLDYRLHRWQQALPAYDLELEKILLKLESTSCPEGLYLHGNYLGGIGLSKILERSDTLAEEIGKKHG